MGLEDSALAKDPRFGMATINAPANFAAAREIIAARMRERTAEEWSEIFDEHGVWYAPIVSFDQVATDEQAISTGAIAPPTAGVPWALVGSPVQFSAVPENRPQGPAPDLGEHTGQVLESLGLSESEQKQLAQAGAFGSPSPSPKL